jgi:hypothetical protein
VKLTTIAVFGIGYVLGSRAGRERYEQIVEATREAGKRLDERRSAATHREPAAWSSATRNGTGFDWSEPLPRT